MPPTSFIKRRGGGSASVQENANQTNVAALTTFFVFFSSASTFRWKKDSSWFPWHRKLKSLCNVHVRIAAKRRIDRLRDQGDQIGRKFAHRVGTEVPRIIWLLLSTFNA
jgi:hypothetical protein